MIKTRFNYLIYFLALFIGHSTYILSPNTITFAQQQNQPQDLQIKIYLIADDDDGKLGKKIGCGDSLVPITKTVKNTSAPLKTVIEELLSIPADYNENPQLHNYWKGTNLKVTNVSIKSGIATINITGNLSVAGICDEPRIVSQIEETAKQLPEVKKVKVFVNKRPLAEAIR